MGLSIKIRWFGFLCVLLIFIGAPRFNRQDMLGISRLTGGELGDSKHYVNQVRFLRNEGGQELLQPPFCYRLVPAVLAAPLPLSPMTAVNVVNCASLLGALFFLLVVLQQIEISPGICFLGGLAFVVSFPVFYYSTIGYVDSLLVAALCTAIRLITKGGQTMWLLLLSLVSAGINEKYAVLFPFWLMYLIWVDKKSLLKSVGVIGLAFCLFALAMTGIRYLTPTPQFAWPPSADAIYGNIVRPKMWLSLMFTWGPLGATISYFLIRHVRAVFEDRQVLVWLVGIAAGLSVWVYGFFSCYNDGRYVWICYPFMVPLFCIYLERFSPAFGTSRQALNCLVARS